MKVIGNKINLSKKEIKRLQRSGRLRDGLEIWIDRHNHKLELARTIGNFISASLSFLIFLKIFKIISQ